MSSRLVTMLERLQADAVESKFATPRECAIYRQAVADMLNMVRGEGWEIKAEPRGVVAEPMLLEAAERALALIEKGAPGWGVAKDLLRAAIHEARAK